MEKPKVLKVDIDLLIDQAMEMIERHKPHKYLFPDFDRKLKEHLQNLQNLQKLSKDPIW